MYLLGVRVHVTQCALRRSEDNCRRGCCPPPTRWVPGMLPRLWGLGASALPLSHLPDPASELSTS